MPRDPEIYPNNSLTSDYWQLPNDLAVRAGTKTQVSLKIRAESNQLLIKRDSNGIRKNCILQAFSKPLIVRCLNSGL